MALDFDGVSQYAEIPYNANHDFSGNFTISLWVNADTTPDCGILSRRINPTYDGYEIGIATNKVYWDFFSLTPSTISESGTLTASTDTHYIFIYNGSSVIIYKDGAIDTTTAVTGSITNSGTATIRIADDFYSNFFDGRIWDVRLYDRAITSDEAELLYNNKGYDDLNDGLVSRLHFDEKTSGTATGSDTLIDLSGIQQNATPYNSPIYEAKSGYYSPNAIGSTVVSVSSPDQDLGSFDYGVLPVLFDSGNTSQVQDLGTFNYGLLPLLASTISRIQPVITLIKPTYINRGETKNITIKGANFESGATISFSGDGLTINSTTYVSSSTYVVNLTASNDAELTKRDVSILNPSNAFYSKSEALLVVDYSLSLIISNDYKESSRILQYDANYKFIRDISSYVDKWKVDVSSNDRYRQAKLTIKFKDVIPSLSNSFLRVTQTVEYQDIEKTYERGWFMPLSPQGTDNGYGKEGDVTAYDGIQYLKELMLINTYSITSSTDIENELKNILNLYDINRYQISYLNLTFNKSIKVDGDDSLLKLLEKVTEVFDGFFYFTARNTLRVSTKSNGKYWGELGDVGEKLTEKKDWDYREEDQATGVLLEYGAVGAKKKILKRNNNLYASKIQKLKTKHVKAEWITDDDEADAYAEEILLTIDDKGILGGVIGAYWDMNIDDVFKSDGYYHKIKYITYQSKGLVDAQGEKWRYSV